ncbi:MAG TPA: TolC family protein [Opitutaceae bacterium]|jgi:outer membrane protein TolC
MPEDYLPGLVPLLKAAVERSPTMIASSINVASSQAGVLAGISPMLPQLSGSAQYLWSKESTLHGPSSAPTSGLYYSLGVTQNLFEWGALKNAAVIARLNRDIAERQYSDAYRMLAISIREQYMILITKHIVLRNARFALKLANENLQVAQARFDAGNSSEAEIGNVKLAVEQAQLDADAAQEDFSYADRMLTRLAGVDVLAEEQVPIELPHPAFAPEMADAIVTGFVGGGDESTFQSQIYKMEIDADRRNYKIAKVRLLPKVSFGAGASYSNQSEPVGNTINQVGVQAESYNVAANWAIFDGFATRAAKEQALDAIATAKHQMQTFVDQSVDQVYDMRKELELSYRAMKLAEVHNGLIEAEVKRIGDDKGLGYASQATVDAGIMNQNATQLNQALARNNFYSRWTEFVSTTGVDPVISMLSPRYGR